MFQCKCIGMKTFFCNLIFCCSVAQSCSTLCNPMSYCTPGLPVPHHLPKFAQVHVQESVMSPNHLILLCLTLLLPSIFARIPMSQLFTSGKILEFQLQHQSFQWVFKVDFHLDWVVWSPCCSRDSQKSSPAQQFQGINSLVLCFFYSSALTTIRDHQKENSLDNMNLCVPSNGFAFQHTV